MQESRRITRKSASNLALAFILLPRQKREGMSALYAFCREVDDIADEESLPVSTRREQLAAWRADLSRAYADCQPEFHVNRELRSVIRTYSLPFALFDELLQGVEMDLDIKRYATLDDLDVYCYRVASVVGLLSIEIFGYRNPSCREYAIQLGKALQLTNILRDVGSDAARGRIYLPLAELQRFGVPEQDILAGRRSPGFVELGLSIAQRARSHYRQARQLLPEGDRKSMIAAEMMGSVYWRLLRKLERGGFNVLGPFPTRLGKTYKAALIARAWICTLSGAGSPQYGL